MKQAESKSDIIKEKIKNGEIVTKINPEKQKRHILGEGYIFGRSYIYGDLDDAQKLVDMLSGTGDFLFNQDGVWLKKERVTHSKIVGVHVDLNGKKFKTKNLTIMYSNTGTHVVPRGR